MCGLWFGQKLWFRLTRAQLGASFSCSLYRVWFVPQRLPKPHPRLGGCVPFEGGVLGGQNQGLAPGEWPSVRTPAPLPSAGPHCPGVVEGGSGGQRAVC